MGGHRYGTGEELERLIVDRLPRKLKSFLQNCPFCPGNENLMPPEILRVPNGDGAWKIRVVPNKFAALARAAK